MTFAKTLKSPRRSMIKMLRNDFLQTFQFSDCYLGTSDYGRFTPLSQTVKVEMV